jgi:hypothetical protein
MRTTSMPEGIAATSANSRTRACEKAASRGRGRTLGGRHGPLLANALLKRKMTRTVEAPALSPSDLGQHPRNYPQGCQ